MKFSDSLWQHISPIYNKILHHPFNKQLMEGRLEQERFIFYMEQDAYYLVGFSRALALIAGRAHSSTLIYPFLNFSLYALVAERKLHAHFIPSNCDCGSIEPSPACIGYVQHLIATATTSSLEEAVAAVLPCFWIYREVGRAILAQAKPDNPYMCWIATYSSEEFAEGVDQVISILDGMANPSSVERMRRAFEYCSLFEWHFWNDAYEMAIFNKIAFHS